MRKLIQGIVEFRRKRRPEYRDTFARLALGQRPDALFVACSDSRVAANVFASTEPGDMFVVRNVGNLVPPCAEHGAPASDSAVGAAIEFAVQSLSVSDIIVCGHSECGAVGAILNGLEKVPPNLRQWLRHGLPALERMGKSDARSPQETHRLLSQLNVRAQLEHLMTYPMVRERVEAGTLRLHGWWFDIRNAEVCAYDEEFRKFVVIDEAEARRLLDQMDAAPARAKS
jgi:carbonic anhydrase